MTLKKSDCSFTPPPVDLIAFTTATGSVGQAIIDGATEILLGLVGYLGIVLKGDLVTAFLVIGTFAGIIGFLALWAKGRRRA